MGIVPPRCGVLGDPPFDRVAAEPAAGAGGEQGLAWLAATFGEPGAKHGNGPGGEWGDPLLAAFAGAGDVRPGAEVEPVPVDSAAFWIYRLDAAAMLALLFNSEASHAELGPPAADRLREVHLRLVRELSK